MLVWGTKALDKVQLQFPKVWTAILEDSTRSRGSSGQTVVHETGREPSRYVSADYVMIMKVVADQVLET